MKSEEIRIPKLSNKNKFKGRDLIGKDYCNRGRETVAMRRTLWP